MKHMAISMGIYEQWNISNGFHFVRCAQWQNQHFQWVRFERQAPSTKATETKRKNEKRMIFFVCAKNMMKNDVK